eukprot:CAMPEP_0177743844 /NCGR_PEP_ID=MMETSP0484_2-20121128/29412_1 /TAXON_ID=354590 /ORGANISM="Rhodomonas lens, Strain RHODO" /LENGTH=71 /DNA_ID=CAMNT_0019258273 /DNA_START=18 /DNA_END=230 /DNA_ORIENTATION=+
MAQKRAEAQLAVKEHTRVLGKEVQAPKACEMEEQRRKEREDDEKSWALTRRLDGDLNGIEAQSLRGTERQS